MEGLSSARSRPARADRADRRPGQATGEPLLYLVRETKPTIDLDHLRPEEKGKVLCGQKHFSETLGVNYKVVSNVKEL